MAAATLGVVTIATMFSASRTWAAGAAFVVETAEVSSVGSCKVESWVSWASNRDFFSAANPSCVVDLGRPIELSAQLVRLRSDDEWTTGLVPKIKTNLVPTEIGRFGWAISAAAAYDLITRQNVGYSVVVPGTLRLSDVVRINTNTGWLWDRVIDRHYFSYGVGVDWRTPDNVWTLTAEVFGLVAVSRARAIDANNDMSQPLDAAEPAADTGGAESSGIPSTVTRPRFQVGMRWRPVDRFNLDLIYGRNVYGENANWFTVSTTIRFPPPGK